MNRGTLQFAAVLAALGWAFFTGEAVTARKDPPGPVIVTYWEKWTDFEFAAIKEIVNDFNASQSEIRVELLAVSNIADKTMMAISAGVPPDIAGLFGANLPQYADANAITPLCDMMTASGLTEDYYVRAYWDRIHYRGKTWALPSTPASVALHLNYDALRTAGLDPNNPPRTIEELDAMGQQITQRRPDGSIEIAGFLPTVPGWWNWAWGPLFGGRLWDGVDTITADEPENVRAFEWVQSYSRRYGPGNVQTFQQGFGNFQSTENPFLTGKVAMVLQGVWMDNFVDRFRPGMEYVVAPWPHPADRPDLAYSAIIDLDILVIPRGAENPEEAFEFIRYIQRHEVMEKLCRAHGKNSPLAHVTPDFWVDHPNPHIRVFDKLARSKNTVSPPMFGIWPQYGAELAYAFDQVNHLRQSPEEALRNVRERMQPKLDQYLRRLKQRGKL